MIIIVVSLVCCSLSKSLTAYSQLLTPKQMISLRLEYQKRSKEGGKTWEIGTEIQTLLCIKQITNEDLLYSTGESI